jgi:hypothetical protein
MLAFDHVIYGTSDMDLTASRWLDAYGLGSYTGGRHSGQGTGNRIVPLGAGYLELMGVVDRDEAAASAIGLWLNSSIADGDRLFAWCLRTDDIDAVSTRLGLVPLPWTRERPDGSVLAWRLAGLERSVQDPSLPFFIQWDVPDDLQPGHGKADHRLDVDGISWIEVVGDREGIEASLDGAHLDVRYAEGGGRGVTRVGVRTSDGELVIS